MKKLSGNPRFYLIFQIIFMILTFVGGILLFVGKLDNAGMSVCSMVMFLAFGSLYNATKNK